MAEETKLYNNNVLNRTKEWMVKPAFSDKESIPIGITASPWSTFSLSVLLQSIYKYRSEENPYDIVVFHTGLLEHYQDMLRDEASKQKDVSLRFVELTAELRKDLDTVSIPNLDDVGVCRLAIPVLMSHYDKVISLGSDYLFLADPASLYKYDLGDDYLAACRDTGVNAYVINNTDLGICLPEDFHQRQRTNLITDLGMNTIMDYFNANCMLLNVKELTKKHVVDEIIYQYESIGNFCNGDQDAWNKVCYTHVRFLSQAWNHLCRDTKEALLEKAALPAIYKEYIKSGKHPKGLSFCYAPFARQTVEHSKTFWQIARDSLFYEAMLNLTFQSRQAQGEEKAPETEETVSATEEPAGASEAKVDIIEPAFAADDIVPIVAVSSNEYVPFLSVMLRSVVMNRDAKRHYDINIFMEDINSRNQEILRKNTCIDNNISLRFVNLKDSFNYFAPPNVEGKMKNFFRMTFLRFAILDLMKKYDKVLYLDTDMVVTTDVGPLIDLDLKDKYVAAVRDTGVIGISYKKNGSFWPYPEDACQALAEDIEEQIGMVHVKDYFNAGLIVFNIKELGKDYTTKDLFARASAHPSMMQDQDVLNHVCFGKVYFLDNEWNYFPQDFETETEPKEAWGPDDTYATYIEAGKAPKCIHYAGRRIPCWRPQVDKADIYWQYARQTDFYEEILCKMAETATKAAGDR